MKWFQNLNTSTKLWLGFGLMSILMGVTGWVAIRNMGIINDNVDSLYNLQMLPSLDLAKTRGIIHQKRLGVVEILVAKEPAKIKELVDQIHALHKELKTVLAKFETTIQDDEVRKEFNKLQNAVDSFYQWREENVLTPALAGQVDVAQKNALSQ